MGKRKYSFDAGHGGFGVTPGKRIPDGSMYEWDFNNAVVRYIMAELSRYKDVELKRFDDPTGKTDVPLSVRSKGINEFQPDCHFSIHANASSDSWNDGAYGLETFVYDKDDAASFAWANAIQNAIVAATGKRNRGVKEGNLHMVRETKKAKAKILVEGPFMNNHKEATDLKSDSFRRTYASAIVKAIVAKDKLVLNDQKADGWSLENHIWYFYSNGVRKTGWIKDKNKWYFLDEKGQMKTGWVKYKEKWYFLAPSGEMLTGWLPQGKVWYYLSKDTANEGAMVVGWEKIDGETYFFHENGQMAANEQIPANLGENGALID